MGKDTVKQHAAFRRVLSEAHDPARALNEKRYLKSPYKFFGVTVPFIVRMAREFKGENRDAAREFVMGLSGALWASDYHQEKTLAVKLLEQYPEHLDLDAMPVLERMLSQCNGWDHADFIANHLVHEVLKKDRKAYSYLRRWSSSENLWMRRASLVSQILLFREGKGDSKLFFRLAEKMLDEKEFFIRKAIGWTVREMSKADPGTAYDFLMKIKGRASGLTLREGAKRLPEDMKRKVIGG